MRPYLQVIPYRDLSSWGYGLLSYENSHAFKYPMAKIGQVVKEYTEKAFLKDDERYTRVKIKINNNGVVKRDTLLGKDIKTKGQYYVKKGQFIFSHIDARNGAFGIVPDDLDGAIITNSFAAFDCDEEKINPLYLNLLVCTDYFKKIWLSLSVGTTNRRSVSTEKFLDVKIPVPSLSEQEQIVAHYKNTLMDIESELLDECTIYNIVENFLAKELKIVRQEIDNTGLFSTINYSEMDTWGVNFSQRAMLKSLLYPTKKLIRLCSIGSGGTPSRSHPEYYQGTTPWVKTGEILNDIIYDTEEKITQEAINNSSAKIYPVGSLIMAMYGQGMTRGRTAKLGVDATTNQACAVMHEFKEEIYPDYLWVYLMGEYNHIRPLASGNNQPNLSAEKIKNYPIILPPLEEQKRLAEEVFVLKENLKIQRKEILCRIEKAKQDFENAIFGE